METNPLIDNASRMMQIARTTMKKTKKATLDSKEFSNQALDPHVRWVAEGSYGDKRATRVAEIMTDITGKPVTRQMVERWLHPDADRRGHPFLGTGLLLLACCTRLQGGAPDRITITLEM